MAVHSEIFGISEDESAEFDHSEDSENGRLPIPIIKLCLESDSCPQPERSKN